MYAQDTRGISYSGVQARVAAGEARTRAIHRSGDRYPLMPDQDVPPTPTADLPQAQPTTVSTKLTLHDLFTGGWKRPLTGLPTALGRPLARSARAARTRAEAFKARAAGDRAPQ